jgi:hypothetical protein
MPFVTPLVDAIVDEFMHTKSLFTVTLKLQPTNQHPSECVTSHHTYIMRRIHQLLGKYPETNNETTVAPMQRRSKHASTTVVTVGNGVFYSVHAEELS